MALLTELDLVASPSERKLGQELSDPGIAARIAEEDQVRPTDVVGGHVDIIFDRQIATVMAPPLRGEAIETRVGPGAYGRVPRLPGPTDAEEPGGEGIVDGSLKPWPLARHDGPVPAIPS